MESIYVRAARKRWKDIPSNVRSKKMSQLSMLRWDNTSREARLAAAMKMVEGRKKKKKLHAGK